MERIARGAMVAKVRGTIVLQLVKTLRAFPERAREVLPEEYHRLIEGFVHPSKWYDEDDHLVLHRAVAEVLEGSSMVLNGMDPREFMGMSSAEEEFSSLFKPLAKGGDLAFAVLKTLESFWPMRHDTGEMRVYTMGPREACIELHDYHLVDEGLCVTIWGHCRWFLTLAGARDVELVERRCRARGDRYCGSEVRWRDVSEMGESQSSARR